MCLIDVKAPVNFPMFCTPLNLLALASYLCEKKVISIRDIKIVTIQDMDELGEILADFNPDLVGMSVVTAAYPKALLMAEDIKSKYKCPVIIGGHHISGYPEGVLTPFDAGVIGEGEGALAEIVGLLKAGKSLTIKNLSKIRNVVYRDEESKLKINQIRKPLDPGTIPHYRWDLLDKAQIVHYVTVLKGKNKAEPVKFAQLFTSRGCPYRCAFCARQVISELRGGFRFLPVDWVIEEISFLYRKYKVENIMILDDTFMVNKDRLREIKSKLKKVGLLGKVKFPELFCCANMVDDEFMELLKSLGVVTCDIGIESGSPKILKYLKNGVLTVQQVKNAVKVFAKYGIYCVGTMMFFTLDEKRRDIEDSLNLMRWLVRQKNMIQVTPFITTPYPGTKLWNDAVMEGLIDVKKPDWNKFFHVRSENIYENVFFKNGLSERTIQNYWEKVVRMVNGLFDRIDRKSGWSEAQKMTNVLNWKINREYSLRKKVKSCLSHQRRSLRDLKDAIKICFNGF